MIEMKTKLLIFLTFILFFGIVIKIKSCESDTSNNIDTLAEKTSTAICDTLMSGRIVEALHFKAPGFALNDKDSLRILLRIEDVVYKNRKMGGEDFFVVGDSVFKPRKSDMIRIYRHGELIKEIKIRCYPVDPTKPYR